MRLSRPWDGPAGIVLTDGRYAACCLDRNGLRPARYVITTDRHITIASEIGVYDYDDEDVVSKGRLGPGEMLAVDLVNGVLLDNDDIHDILKTRAPYKKWLKKGVRYLDSELIDTHIAAEPMEPETLATYQKMFNVSRRSCTMSSPCSRRQSRKPSARWATTRRWPCCRKQVRSPFDYFRQQFAQVTNPPIDSLRERIVMSSADQCRSRIEPFRYRPRARRTGAHELAGVVAAEAAPAAERRLVRRQSRFRRPECREALSLPEALDPHLRAGGTGRAGWQADLFSVIATWPGKLPVHALLATGAVHHHLVARIALRCEHHRRDRRRARSASLRLPDRLRCDRCLSLPRLPVAA